MIALSEVRVAYGTFEALRGISCIIDGGAVGLLGPNGAGKSTLLKTLLGFVRAVSGQATMFGLDMPAHALKVRQRLGYMPEREVVSPKVSAVSFLTYCAQLFGMSRVDAMERAHEVLNYVGIGESRYRKMETYSTGMRQRVKFAQALTHDPKLLLLDEPTSGLDPEGRVEMLDLISDLAHKRKVTVILSTHLLPDVEHVCDRVLMINKGRIVVDAPIGDLTREREGLFEVRVRDGKEEFLATLRGHGFDARAQQSGSVLVCLPADTGPAALFEAARAQGTQVRHFRAVRQSLEDVFLQAISQGPEPAAAGGPQV